jgi:toxin ParE1/3/4
MPIWTAPAIDDAQQAWDNIAEYSEAAADKMLAIVYAAAGRLDRFPRLGRPASLKNARQFFVPRTQFKLIYRILESGDIEIVRVYHTSRDWPPKD